MLGVSKNMLQLITAIAVTGALLNLANSGLFGSLVQDASKFITRGYGAGNL